MWTGRRITSIAFGVLLLGVAVCEHLQRRAVERRYREAVAARRQLERQVGQTFAAHRQLAADVKREQRRSQELSDALASTRAELEQAVGRLAEERRGVQKTQLRVATLQQQVDQLQGELALTLQARQGPVPAMATEPVQLERIIVTDPGALGLRGRVVSVHRDWNFVVIDLGWNDVRIGDTVSIFRNDQLLAKAKIERVQEQVCAATLLPEWTSVEIQVNDLARIL